MLVVVSRAQHGLNSRLIRARQRLHSRLGEQLLHRTHQVGAPRSNHDRASPLPMPPPPASVLNMVEHKKASVLNIIEYKKANACSPTMARHAGLELPGLRGCSLLCVSSPRRVAVR